MNTQMPVTPDTSERKSPATAGTSPAPAQPVIVLRAVITRSAEPAAPRRRGASRG
jgi:hypothetical protein